MGMLGGKRTVHPLERSAEAPGLCTLTSSTVAGGACLTSVRLGCHARVCLPAQRVVSTLPDSLVGLLPLRCGRPESATFWRRHSACVLGAERTLQA